VVARRKASEQMNIQIRGKSYLIEKSKRKMIAEDIKAALEYRLVIPAGEFYLTGY